MKKLILLLLAWPMLMNGQNSVTFTFTGLNGSSYFQLDSLKVKNLTQDCDTVLYYPDTVLFIYNVGIKQKPGHPGGFKVMQNYPNPVSDQTSIMIYVPQQGLVDLDISDAMGRNITTSSYNLEKGRHSFIFSPPDEGIYFFNAGWNGTSSNIKILAAATISKRSCILKYSGSIPDDAPVKGVSAMRTFLFSPGDELMMIGYGDDLESGFMDYPETSQDYIFQFATNIPCPGTDSLYYDGQWYHTIQIFGQCWMKENLNVGVMVLSAQGQANNGIIEKFCMGDYQYYCSLFGGLYFWDEMMQYTNATGGQGICPEGWHVPGDFEWQILEGAVDSTYMIGDPEWGQNGWRGSDAGGNLKQTGTGLWEYPNTGATDAFSFTAIPGGYFVQNDFWGPGYKCYLWSSQSQGKHFRNLDWNQAKIQRNTGGGGAAFSVRCVRN